MPLIVCRDCGHRISPRATRCPACGSPTGEVSRRIFRGSALAAVTAAGCLVASILVAVGIFAAVSSAAAADYWDWRTPAGIVAGVGLIAVAAWLKIRGRR